MSLRLKVILAAVAAGLAAWLALVDPVTSPAPQCIFRRLTGYDCPGCGTQRAIHAIFRGDIASAWDFNPALFIAAPLIILYLADPPRLRRYLYSTPAPFIIAAAIVAWWIFRNIFL